MVQVPPLGDAFPADSFPDDRVERCAIFLPFFRGAHDLFSLLARGGGKRLGAGGIVLGTREGTLMLDLRRLDGRILLDIVVWTESPSCYVRGGNKRQGIVREHKHGDQ